MIMEPNISKLMAVKNIDSRYTLVVAAAKRARAIAREDAKLDKTVKMAVNEIAKGKIRVIPVSEKTAEPVSEEEAAAEEAVQEETAEEEKEETEETEEEA